MKGPVFVFVLLVILSAVAVCPIGLWKCWQLRRSRSGLLVAHAALLFGVGYELIAAVMASQYGRVKDPSSDYLWWSLSGRFVVALSAFFSVGYFLKARE